MGLKQCLNCGEWVYHPYNGQYILGVKDDKKHSDFYTKEFFCTPIPWEEQKGCSKTQPQRGW